MITCKVEKITPDIAKEMLRTNTSNRPLSQSNINRIAAEMKAGNYMVNGETVKISKTGKLLDSQHRLHAVVLSGVTIETLVARGVEDEVFKTIDTGKSRTPADILGIEGVKDPKQAAAVCKFVILFSNNMYSAAAGAGGINGGVSVNARKYALLSNTIVSEFYKKNSKAIQESIPYGYDSKNKLTTPSIISGTYFICRKRDIEAANDFFHRLTTGVDLKMDSPIFVLRNYLLTLSRQSGIKRDTITNIAMICKAWNQYRKKEKGTRQSISWKKGIEAFPIPQ